MTPCLYVLHVGRYRVCVSGCHYGTRLKPGETAPGERYLTVVRGERKQS